MPGKEQEVKSFMKENHINVIRQHDIEQVLIFCSQLAP
jgi:hypothetical protein